MMVFGQIKQVKNFLCKASRRSDYHELSQLPLCLFCAGALHFRFVLVCGAVLWCIQAQWDV